MLYLLTALTLSNLAFGQVSIETPSFTQCESATITWSGGSGKSDQTPRSLNRSVKTDIAAPYTVYIYPEFYLDPSSFL